MKMCCLGGKNSVVKVVKGLRSQASHVLIQLAWYVRVLFSGCTVNFREPMTFCGSQLDIMESVEAASACHGVVVCFVGESQALG